MRKIINLITINYCNSNLIGKKKFRPLGGNSPESAWHHSAEAGGIMSLVLTDKSVQESVLELVEDSIVIVIVIEVVITTIVVVIKLTG
jgi:hypothetical protein